jgi:hypothetical protein
MKTATYLLITVLAVFSSSASAQEPAQDSALVRIRTGDTATTIRVNGQEIGQDFFGASLQEGQWFILKLPSGNYLFEFVSPQGDFFDTTLTITGDSVYSLDLLTWGRDTTREPHVDSTGGVQATLYVESVPDSTDIVLDRKLTGQVTPAEFQLPPGSHTVELVKPGYEPLAERIDLAQGDSITATFLLRVEPPPPLTPESLGLQLLKEKPLLKEEKAEVIRQRCNAFAETFAIAPLTQGILAKMLLTGSGEKQADMLIISGAVLTAGMYLAGKIFSTRKRLQIRRTNQLLAAENLEIKAQNKEVRKIVQQRYAELVKQWQKQNRNTGKVIITKKEPQESTR